MKIDLEKTQNMLDWLKTKLFLDSIADKAKNRIVHRGEVYECNFGIGIGSEMQKDRPCVIIQGNIQTVSKARLGNYITRLSKNDIKEIDNALYVSIGLIKNIKSYEKRIENLEKYIDKLKKNN